MASNIPIRVVNKQKTDGCYVLKRNYSQTELENVVSTDLTQDNECSSSPVAKNFFSTNETFVCSPSKKLKKVEYLENVSDVECNKYILNNTFIITNKNQLINSNDSTGNSSNNFYDNEEEISDLNPYYKYCIKGIHKNELNLFQGIFNVINENKILADNDVEIVEELQTEIEKLLTSNNNLYSEKDDQLMFYENLNLHQEMRCINEDLLKLQSEIFNHEKSKEIQSNDNELEERIKCLKLEIQQKNSAIDELQQNFNQQSSILKDVIRKNKASTVELNEQNSVLINSLEDYKHKIYQLELNNTKRKDDEVSNLRSCLFENNEKYNFLSSQNNDFKTQIDKLTVLLDIERNNNNNFKLDLEKYKTQMEQFELLNENLNKGLNDLKKEIKSKDLKLEQTTERERQASLLHQELQNTIEKEREKYQSTKKQLEEERDLEREKLNNHIQFLETNRIEERQKIEKFEFMQKQMQQEKDQEHEKNKQISTVNIQLQQNLNNERKKLCEIQSLNEKLEENLNCKRNKFEKVNLLNSELRKRLNDELAKQEQILKKQLIEENKKVEEVKSLCNELQEKLKNEIEKNEKIQFSNNQLNEELNEEREKSSQLDDECEILLREIKSSEEKYCDSLKEISDCKKTIEILEKKIQSYIDEKIKMELNLKDLQQHLELKRGDNSSLENEIKRLKSDIIKKDNKILTLEERRKTEISVLQNQLMDYKLLNIYSEKAQKAEESTQKHMTDCATQYDIVTVAPQGIIQSILNDPDELMLKNRKLVKENEVLKQILIRKGIARPKNVKDEQS